MFCFLYVLCRIRGIPSEAMIMCASSPEIVEILDPPEGSVVGDRIVFEGYEGRKTSYIRT